MGPASLANVSIVVAAGQHNPSILHPSFLRTAGIVPADWEVAEGPICTPAFSLVGYSNAIVFRVEQSRLQIVDGNPKGEGTGSPIRELAGKYIDKLPHVHYKAVGVNFVTFSACDNADEYIVRRFLSKGTWNDDKLTPISAGVQLTYPITDATLNLSLKPGGSQKQADQDTKVGIVLEANCHRDTQTAEEALAAIERFEQQLKQAWAICARVLEPDGEN